MAFGADELGAYSEVGTADKRGPWLEFGTRYMRPRPHVRPAVLKTTVMIREIVVSAIVENQEKMLARLAVTAKTLGDI
jgi:hypothetical protein